jgi:hypothetical protein
MTGRHRMGLDPIPDAAPGEPDEAPETTEPDGTQVENLSE